MLKYFFLSFKLRNTYKTNGIIWALKGIPLIKRLLPASLYASRGLKIFANLISGFLEFLLAFCGKVLYLFAVWGIAESMDVTTTDAFTHILIFTTLIGGFMNTHIFEPTRDKYYAMFLMRMDVKKYTLTSYIYFMAKMLIGFLLFSTIVGLLIGVSPATYLTLPIYLICVKVVFTAISLWDCKKKKKIINENALTPLLWITVAILLGLAAIPYTGFVLPEFYLWILTAVLLVPAFFAGKYIITFDFYRPIYQKLLKPENYVGNSGAALATTQQLALQKKISTDTSITSNKKGYAYLNDLFIKRHAKLLTKSAKRITIGAFTVVVISAILISIFPNAKDKVNELLMTYLPYFLFVMYMMNRSRVITRAMFMNCDHSMLAYRFYKQPGAILKLFVSRLKYIIFINLMPALIIALGLPLLLYLSGGTEEPLNYLVLFISIISMSIFFSVHGIVLYYLLQPYNVNLESKSATYGIANWITYFLSYMAIRFHLPTLWFGTAITIFCITYAFVAFILAYRLAPKTFKLRG